MTAIKLEDGVPTPAHHKWAAPKYPFAEMQVGQSFAVPRDGRRFGAGDAVQNSVSSCARLWARRNNPSVKFTVRVVDENTVRCWRVA